MATLEAEKRKFRKRIRRKGESVERKGILSTQRTKTELVSPRERGREGRGRSFLFTRRPSQKNGN